MKRLFLGLLIAFVGTMGSPSSSDAFVKKWAKKVKQGAQTAWRRTRRGMQKFGRTLSKKAKAAARKARAAARKKFMAKYLKDYFDLLS